MNEELYRKNLEKMTNAEYIAFVNAKLQEIDILEKILEENKIIKGYQKL
jgi:hypothetical protein